MFQDQQRKNLIWLVWLKEHSSKCADTIIDIDNPNQLPIDGSMFDQLRSDDENDDVNDETGADMGGMNRDLIKEMQLEIHLATK